MVVAWNDDNDDDDVAAVSVASEAKAWLVGAKMVKVFPRQKKHPTKSHYYCCCCCCHSCCRHLVVVVTVQP